jgi:hypothetical protein
MIADFIMNPNKAQGRKNYRATKQLGIKERGASE